MKIVPLWIFLLLTAFVSPLPVLAQGSELRDKASEHMKKGKQFQDIGDHIKAVDEFKAAYELLPHPAVLYNIGNAYRLGGNKGEAIKYFEKFVALEAAGDLVENANGYLVALKPAWAAEKKLNAQKEVREREAAEAAAKAAEAKQAEIAKRPPPPTAPKATGSTGQHFFIGLGLGMNTCFEIGNKLCSSDNVASHSASYAITLSPGYRFHKYVGATLDIGFGALTPKAEAEAYEESDLGNVSTMTIGATAKAFVPAGPLELVAGLGFGHMTISNDAQDAGVSWSGTALKVEGGAVYGSMGAKPGLGIGLLIGYHLGLGGSLSGDGADSLSSGEFGFEDGSPFFDLLQFNLAVSYAL